MKTDNMASVMFRSAFPPRSHGPVTSKPCGVCTPQPMVPTPGSSPHQLVNRMKMKIVAKNQNVFFTRSAQDALKKLVKAFHQPFPEILRPAGNLFHIPRRQPANTMIPSATIHVTSMELVTGKAPI